MAGPGDRADLLRRVLRRLLLADHGCSTSRRRAARRTRPRPARRGRTPPTGSPSSWCSPSAAGATSPTWTPASRGCGSASRTSTRRTRASSRPSARPACCWSANNMQAIFGTRSENLKTDMEEYLKTAGDEAEISDEAAREISYEPTGGARCGCATRWPPRRRAASSTVSAGRTTSSRSTPSPRRGCGSRSRTPSVVDENVLKAAGIAGFVVRRRGARAPARRAQRRPVRRRDARPAGGSAGSGLSPADDVGAVPASIRVGTVPMFVATGGSSTGRRARRRAARSVSLPGVDVARARARPRGSSCSP